MTETDNFTENLTEEELAEYQKPQIEEADEDAEPGDLSGGRTDVDGGIDDDSGFLEDVDAYANEPAAPPADGDAQ
jgi:hypothetical protein